MTTRWKEPVVCECGHKGIVHWSENDQPFSSQWETYRIEGFEGEGFEIAGSCTLDDAIERMKAVCPICGAVGKIKYAPES
jgi:hypothetical protein